MRPSRLLLAVFLVGLTLPAAAQPQPDFLFSPKRFSLAFHIGLDVPRQQSDVYDFLKDELTLESRDFRALLFGGDLSVRLSDRADIFLSVDTARSDTDSEYRRFVDNANLPIEQNTTLRQTTSTVGLRLYLLPRGERVGSYAYLPRRFQPYVGGAVGFNRWHLQQTGDFVDFQTLAVFPDYFFATGTAMTAEALAGTHVGLTRWLQLSLEGRYRFGSDDLSDDFVGFDPIDLSGPSGLVALRLVF
jgi:hypothetical protein